MQSRQHPERLRTNSRGVPCDPTGSPLDRFFYRVAADFGLWARLGETNKYDASETAVDEIHERTFMMYLLSPLDAAKDNQDCRNRGLLNWACYNSKTLDTTFLRGRLVT
jgi:hypothetical protein